MQALEMDRNFSHDERKKNLLKTFLSVVLSFAFEAKAKKLCNAYIFQQLHKFTAT